MWLYRRFPLSYREIDLMMAERGVDVTYETIRTWCRRFGPSTPAGCAGENPVRGHCQPDLPALPPTASPDDCPGHRTELAARFQIWDQVTEQTAAA